MFLTQSDADNIQDPAAYSLYHKKSKAEFLFLNVFLKW